ncbi:TlpA family protein disulfide reductase [Microscilla marina]|uniref:Thioredoxin family protein n=1 Tax=Microscilla marina ATCC 23134 TaxID=313606 RepID=A1ZSS9_MICM2|nr:TlpA disulfide reductase family protein [Microscilla marina]EAY26493.1 thioredoxin family protein [Microscilla marina ATCC 23134]
MKTKLFKLLAVVIVAGLAIAATLPNTSVKDKTANNEVVFIDAKGKKFDEVLKQFKGKVVYIDFWATWCGPCRGQMPYSRKLHEEFKGKDVVFLYISFDRGEKAWRKGIEKMKIQGHHWKPDQKQIGEINKRFKVQYIPRYMLVGKDGKLLADDFYRPSSAKAKKLIGKALDM